MGRFRVGVATWVVLLMAAVASGQTSSVNGRVTDSQGGVIANADVTLGSLPGPAMPGMKMTAPPPRTTRATAAGTFTFDNVPAGQYVLQVDAPGFERSSQEVTVSDNGQPLAITLERFEIPGAEAEVVAAPAKGGGVDPQVLLDQIRLLQERIGQLEASTVLSEPETRVKRIQVWVDKNGVEYDHPVDGAKPKVTYQRERVYRRQTISEKIEEALTDAENRNVKLGVSAASVTQFTRRTRGGPLDARNRVYQLSSADLLFTAGLAQYTMFFADIVGLSGAPPDAEIHNLTLFNSYSARLVRNNEVNIREAWLRTELFSQKLALIAGRVDLTNYFDRNAVANDETTQFISDALVNNPALVLPVNGSGVVGVFDPKNGLTFKAGFQQSNNEATNLSESIYSLAEVGYLVRLPGLSEGNYRLWYRSDNSTDRLRGAIGVSIDQKIMPTLTLFGRYGTGQVDAPIEEATTRLSTGHHFYSGGFQVRNEGVFNPLDIWGFGYAQTSFPSGPSEKLVEGYYNFKISEKLRLSFQLQHILESPGGTDSVRFLVPAVRLQAAF